MGNWSPAMRMRLIRASGRTAICARAATPSKQALPRCSAISSGTLCSDCPEATEDETMNFGLNESQEILKESARKFFAGECPIAEVRRLIETETAYDAALWKKLAEQGYTGIIFQEEFGGVGLGIVELALLMEEAGRALLPGPFFSTVALAGGVLNTIASHEQKKKYLAPICRGEARATVAILEAPASWNLESLQMSA